MYKKSADMHKGNAGRKSLSPANFGAGKKFDDSPIKKRGGSAVDKLSQSAANNKKVKLN